MIVLADEFVSIKLLLCWYSNSLYFRFLFIALHLFASNSSILLFLLFPLLLHCSLDSTSRRKLGIVFVGRLQHGLCVFFAYCHFFLKFLIDWDNNGIRIFICGYEINSKRHFYIFCM